MNKMYLFVAITAVKLMQFDKRNDVFIIMKHTSNDENTPIVFFQYKLPVYSCISVCVSGKYAIYTYPLFHIIVKEVIGLLACYELYIILHLHMYI